MFKEVLQGKYIRFWIDSDILYSEGVKKEEYTLEMVKEAIELRHKISEGILD